MENSPLLYIDNDVSNIIGIYIKTYKSNQNLIDDLNQQIKKSLIKSFNIKLYELPYYKYITSNNNDLYRLPNLMNKRKIKEYVWIWSGKRINEPTKNFLIRRISRKKGVYSMSTDIRSRYPSKERRQIFYENREEKPGWTALLFPIYDITKLKELGYFNTYILLNEVKNN